MLTTKRWLWYAAGAALALTWSGEARAAGTPRVIASVRLPFTSSAAPVVGDADGDGRPDVAVTSDHIGSPSLPLDDPRNPNSVTVFHWSNGRLVPRPGWPRKTRDATLGLAMADLNGDGRDEVLAACGQDFAVPVMERVGFGLTSRLYVWRGDGSGWPGWFPAVDNAWPGLAFGHAYAAPVVMVSGNGISLIQPSQGQWVGQGFQHGSLRLWAPDGRLRAFTQPDDPGRPWYAAPGFTVETPAVLADLNGNGTREVVAPTFTGRFHAWNAAGKAMPGWFPSAGAATETAAGALVRGPACAVDLNGDGRDEVAAGAFDGSLTAWTGGGARLWTSRPGAAALTSGVAAGRLRRQTDERNLVAGDALGGVTAWRPDGSVLWRARTTPGNPVQAEPAIGDVNADGGQDVVVGGTDGIVYALDGETGALLWQVAMPAAPTLDGQRAESVFGAPALCDIDGDGSLNVVLATAQRYVSEMKTRTWQGFGHVIVLDCGPGTYRPDRLDWPQYRGGKHRTGNARDTRAHP